jgi:hypothetical protein
MPIYNKIVCLETYSVFLSSKKRNYEAEGKRALLYHVNIDYFKQAQRLKFQIPEWLQRRESLQIPDYQF